MADDMRFVNTITGHHLGAAFSDAIGRAQQQYGYAGHTGTIAEKNRVVLLTYPGVGGAREYLRASIKHLRAQGDYLTHTQAGRLIVAKARLGHLSRATHTPRSWAHTLLDLGVAVPHGPAFAFDLTPKLSGVRKPKQWLAFGLAAC